jgi:hypothetical protein
MASSPIANSGFDLDAKPDCPMPATEPKPSGKSQQGTPEGIHSDVEKETPPESGAPRHERKVSAFKALGWLDRYLAIWILVAMIVGVVLGNFAPGIGPALQRGQFVGVSLPIGMLLAVVVRHKEDVYLVFVADAPW